MIFQKLIFCSSLSPSRRTYLMGINALYIPVTGSHHIVILGVRGDIRIAVFERGGSSYLSIGATAAAGAVDDVGGGVSRGAKGEFDQPHPTGGL